MPFSLFVHSLQEFFKFRLLFWSQYGANLIPPFLSCLVDLRVALCVQRFIFRVQLRQDGFQSLSLVRRQVRFSR